MARCLTVLRGQAPLSCVNPEVISANGLLQERADQERQQQHREQCARDKPLGARAQGVHLGGHGKGTIRTRGV